MMPTSGNNDGALKCGRFYGLIIPASMETEMPSGHPSQSSGRAAAHRSVVIKALLILAVVLFVYASVRVVRHQARFPNGDGDWGVYYRAGMAMRNREPIYTLEYGPLLTFKNAPIVALGLAPLSLLPVGLARWIWLVGAVAALAMTYRLASRVIFRPGNDSAAGQIAIVGGLILSSHFIFDELFSGPTANWILLAMVAAFVWAYEGRAVSAGAALAAGIFLKIVPIALGPWFLLCRRRGASIASLGVSLAAGLLLPALFVGWDRNLSLLKQWPVHLEQTQTPKQDARESNQSVYAEMTRVLSVSPYSRHIHVAQVDQKRIAVLWLLLSIAAACVLYGWVGWSLHRNRLDPGAALCLLLLFVTLFNPLAWRYNFVAVGIPYAYVLYRLVLRTAKLTWIIIGLLAASYVLHWLPDFAQQFGARMWGAVCLGFAVVIVMRPS
jgi:hypothetical protein